MFAGTPVVASQPVMMLAAAPTPAVTDYIAVSPNVVQGTQTSASTDMNAMAIGPGGDGRQRECAGRRRRRRHGQHAFDRGRLQCGRNVTVLDRRRRGGIRWRTVGQLGRDRLQHQVDRTQWRGNRRRCLRRRGEFDRDRLQRLNGSYRGERNGAGLECNGQRRGFCGVRRRLDRGSRECGVLGQQHAEPADRVCGRRHASHRRGQRGPARRSGRRARRRRVDRLERRGGRAVLYHRRHDLQRRRRGAGRGRVGRRGRERRRVALRQRAARRRDARQPGHARQAAQHRRRHAERHQQRCRDRCATVQHQSGGCAKFVVDYRHHEQHQQHHQRGGGPAQAKPGVAQSERRGQHGRHAGRLHRHGGAASTARRRDRQDGELGGQSGATQSGRRVARRRRRDQSGWHVAEACLQHRRRHLYRRGLEFSPPPSRPVFRPAAMRSSTISAAHDTGLAGQQRYRCE